MLRGVTARIVADGSDATVGIVWAVFVVLLVGLVVLGVLALRRFNANRTTLRSEGLGPLSATAQRLGQYADRRPGSSDPEPVADPDEPPTSPADVAQRLDEITDLHDRGILDDGEYRRQRGRMLDP